jgi:ABC-type sugar transport system ATPase subunit
MLPTDVPDRSDAADEATVDHAIADHIETAERTLLPLLSVRGLRKVYGSATVVDDIQLTIPHGTIHALLGENGAGKSTLIKMLAGVVPADGGHIEIDGVRRHARTVAEAQKLGIVALPQELTLVPTLNAPENIFLGQKQPGSFGLVSRRGLEQDAAVQLARLGQRIPLRTPVGELSAVQQTMIALARALARDARLLILDEPTAALTNSETEQLFTVLRSLRTAGTSIIYVSHRLDEVFALADTVTVMRNGARVWTKPVGDTHTDDVVAAMIGRAQHDIFPARATSAAARTDGTAAAAGPTAGSGNAPTEILRLEALQGHRVQDVSLTASTGRILGIAGLAGSGRSELLRLIAGDERMRGGKVLLDGQPLTGGSVTRAMAAGISLVPEERRRQGLVMTASIRSNIALANLAALSWFGIASRRRERAMAERGVAQLQISASSLSQTVDELSGGNQQKVVLAKYLERKPRVLLLDEPTRGIDVGTKAEIYAVIRRLADAGVAVIVVSSEIPELLGLADEIIVLREGRLSARLPAAGTDEATILHHCYRKAD